MRKTKRIDKRLLILVLTRQFMHARVGMSQCACTRHRRDPRQQWLGLASQANALSRILDKGSVGSAGVQQDDELFEFRSKLHTPHTDVDSPFLAFSAPS